VSDTHDNVEPARVAAAFLAREADRVVHLGDVTTRSTAALFGDAVLLRGNNDPPTLGHAEWEETLAGIRVGAHHGHDRWRGSEVDLLLHGHSHRMRHERVGRTLVVNPGALHRASVKSVAVVTLPALDVEFFEVRAEGVRALA